MQQIAHCIDLGFYHGNLAYSYIYQTGLDTPAPVHTPTKFKKIRNTHNGKSADLSKAHLVLGNSRTDQSDPLLVASVAREENIEDRKLV